MLFTDGRTNGKLGIRNRFLGQFYTLTRYANNTDFGFTFESYGFWDKGIRYIKKGNYIHVDTATQNDKNYVNQQQ